MNELLCLRNIFFKDFLTVFSVVIYGRGKKKTEYANLNKFLCPVEVQSRYQTYHETGPCYPNKKPMLKPFFLFVHFVFTIILYKSHFTAVLEFATSSDRIVYTHCLACSILFVALDTHLRNN